MVLVLKKLTSKYVTLSVRTHCKDFYLYSIVCLLHEHNLLYKDFVNVDNNLKKCIQILKGFQIWKILM